MQYLLFIHILSGTVALIAAVVAVVSKKGKKPHVLAGRTYFCEMVIIFIKAIPMTIAIRNVFVLLIAIFSFYLAYAGMRFPRNSEGLLAMAGNVTNQQTLPMTVGVTYQ